MGTKVDPAKVDPSNKLLVEVFNGQGLDFFKDVGNFRFCPTGEPYWTVLSDGIKPEGGKVEAFKSKREAFIAWNKTIKKLVGGFKWVKGDLGRGLTVFWRRMPEMRFFKEDFDGLGGRERWTVYSRFRISSLPIIQSAFYYEVGTMVPEYSPEIKQKEAR